MDLRSKGSRGPGSSLKIFFIFIYFVIWVMEDQELFTELEIGATFRGNLRVTYLFCNWADLILGSVEDISVLLVMMIKS